MVIVLKYFNYLAIVSAGQSELEDLGFSHAGLLCTHMDMNDKSGLNET